MTHHRITIFYCQIVIAFITFFNISVLYILPVGTAVSAMQVHCRWKPMVHGGFSAAVQLVTLGYGEILMIELCGYISPKRNDGHYNL